MTAQLGAHAVGGAHCRRPLCAVQVDTAAGVATAVSGALAGGAAVPPWFIYTAVAAGPKRMENHDDDEASRADLWVTHLVDDSVEQELDDAARVAVAANGGGKDDVAEDDAATPAAKESAATVTVGDRKIKF